MKSLFTQSVGDASSPPAPVAATGWSAVGGKAKLAMGAAAIAAVVVAVVLPSSGDKRAPQPAAPQPQPPSNVNDYAPVPQGILEQVANRVTSAPVVVDAPVTLRRRVPTDMALYAAPAANYATTTPNRATVASDESGGRAAPAEGGADPNDRLAAQLTGATVLPASRAVLVRHPDYTIRPGDPIQCIPQNAENSSMPGFTRCRIPEWVRGHSQRRGLIPPDTVLFGQIRNGVAQGQSRLGVLYTSIEANSFSVPLAAPGQDALGRSGEEGDVNTFFWDRAKAVALYSLLDVAIGAGQNVASSALTQALSGSNGSTLNFGNQAQGLASQEMASRINRPPEITRLQAQPVLVTVGQNLEFYDVCQKLREADPMACPLL